MTPGEVVSDRDGPGPMLFSDDHQSACIMAGCAGKTARQMIVINGAALILDRHAAAVRGRGENAQAPAQSRKLCLYLHEQEQPQTKIA